MANGVSGTKSAPAASQVAPPEPAPQQKVRPAASNGFAAFAAMTPDQQADAINTAINSSVPDHLNSSSDLQKLMYSQKITGLPDVVSDTQFQNTPGTTIYRTVNNVYDSKNDVGYSAPDIATQVMKARHTYVASHGRAVHGEGIYFADDLRDSEGYGHTSGDISKTCVMKAKLKAGARTISSSAAQSAANKEMFSGSKLGKALSKSSDPRALYAACKGYQALSSGWGYYSIIDRSCLVMSDKIQAKR